MKMIRKCAETDFNTIFEIINDAAQAYKDVIPEDRWHEPYMNEEKDRLLKKYWSIPERQVETSVVLVKNP